MDNGDHWDSLRDKAIRGGLWSDLHERSDPVYRTLHGVGKAWIRRINQPYFMESLYGNETTELSLEVAGGQIVATVPRWVAVSLQAWAMMQNRSSDNVLKYLDSLPTVHKDDVVATQPTDGTGEEPDAHAEDREAKE